MLSKTLTIENSEGLHMRPAGVVAKEQSYSAIRESTLRVLSTLFQLVLRQVQKLHLNVTEKMKKQQWLRLKNLQARTLVNNL